MNKVFLSLGSNISPRKNNIKKSIIMIEESGNTYIKSESSLYETKPLNNHNQGYFLNKIILIKTQFNPEELLENIKSIEL